MCNKACGYEEGPPAAVPIVVQVSYQNISRQKKKDKRPSLQEHRARDYSFEREKTRELFKHLLGHNILTLLEVKCSDEVRRNDNPKYCPYHRLISHLIEDYFVPKEIQDLIDRGSISLPDDSIKASVHQASVKEGAQGVNESQKQDDEVTPDSGEEWTVSERKDIKTRREHANMLNKMSRRLSKLHQKEPKLLSTEAKKKNRTEQKGPLNYLFHRRREILHCRRP